MVPFFEEEDLGCFEFRSLLLSLLEELEHVEECLVRRKLKVQPIEISHDTRPLEVGYVLDSVSKEVVYIPVCVHLLLT